MFYKKIIFILETEDYQKISFICWVIDIINKQIRGHKEKSHFQSHQFPQNENL